MKFFNCNNRNGFDIDGTMDLNEANFNNDLCNWQMVSGPSGTLLQSFDFQQDFTDKTNGEIMKNWYFDMATPGVPSDPTFGAPVYTTVPPVGFYLCSFLQNSQVRNVLFLLQ